MKKLLLSLVLGTAVLFSACEKDDEIKPVADYGDPDFNVTVESVVTTDAAIDDIAEAVDYEVDLYTGTAEALDGVTAAAVKDDNLKSGGLFYEFRKRYLLRVCPEIHISSGEGGFPKTITLDYGDGIELVNGRVIAGIVEIGISAPFYLEGATRTVTFNDFSVDSIGINGTNVKTLVETTNEREVHIVRDLVFTLSDGTQIERYAEKTRTWVEGLGTPFYHGDDVWEITGYASTRDSDGNVYRKEITKRLIKKGNCRFIVSGEIELSTNGEVFATIDFGDGECDNVATMTTAEGTKEFIIGKWKRMMRNRNNNQNRNGSNS